MDTTEDPRTVRVQWGARRTYEGGYEQDIHVPEDMTTAEFVRALRDDPDYEGILAEREKDNGECVEGDRWITRIDPDLPTTRQRNEATKRLEDSRRVLNHLETVKTLATSLIEAYQGAGIADLGTSLADAERALEQVTTHAQCAQQFYGLAAITHAEALPDVANFVWLHADTADTAAIEMSGDLQRLAHALYVRRALPTHDDPAVTKLAARVLATGSYYEHAI